MTTLFDPIRVGDLELPSRIIMAPLTRLRAIGGQRVPNALMAEYYVQRASAGLIMTEATAVTPQVVGNADTPGIWTDEQLAGWMQVADAVFLRGKLPVVPSAIAAAGHVRLVRPERAYVTPRALEANEIAGVVAAYRHGAENARRAGFDGMEVHGANGYLLDQFPQDSTNQRTDADGGSIENRARLLLEVTDACVAVWGAIVSAYTCRRAETCIRWAIRTPAATFGYVARELGKHGIAFICSREALGAGRRPAQARVESGIRRSLYRQRKDE